MEELLGDAGLEEPPDAVLPDRIAEEGKVQFYFIDPFGRQDGPPIFVRTAEDFQRIVPAIGDLSPRHRLDTSGKLVFYQRQRIEKEGLATGETEATTGETEGTGGETEGTGGETEWFYYPVFQVSLTGYDGGAMAIKLSKDAGGTRRPEDPVLPLEWIDLSEKFVDFGEFAVVNPFDLPIAVKIDETNKVLQPGEHYRKRISKTRRNTGVVHVRVAVQLVEGEYRKLSDERLFMASNSRAVAIPFFDQFSKRIGFFEFTEQPNPKQ